MARRAARLLGPHPLSGVVLGVVALALLAAPVAAQQLRLVQVPIGGRPGLDSLARLGFEVADVRVLDGTPHAVIVVSPETETLLLRRGFVPQPVERAPLAAVAAADTYRVYRSFEKPLTGIRATLEAWAAADTALHLDSIGRSIEGRPILAVKLGDAADSPARPNVLFMGTHHAREWVATEMAMKLLRWLADSLPPALRGSRDIWVIPVENPDGYQYTFTTERLWRKNRRDNGDGTFGVDPNRNYPAFWGLDDAGSSGAPGSEVYRGAGPASEPETQAIVAFHAAHPPAIAVSYHTFSGLVLHPYGFRTGELAPDRPVFTALAGTDLLPAVRDSVPASALAYYHPGPGWHLYPTNGEYTEWAYRAHGSIAFTPELTSGCCTPVGNLYYGFEFPDDAALVERVFRDNLPFALALIQSAGDLAGARGASGLGVAPSRLESVWPEAWLNLDRAAPRPLTLSVRTATGVTRSRSLQGDSLWLGTLRNWWRSNLGPDTVQAVRVDGAGFEAELLTLAGAEDRDVGWTGWTRSGERVAGDWSWFTNGGAGGAGDTLVSPVADLVGRERIWLQFWTRHFGSTFTPAQRGVVQLSTDSGRTWADVGMVVGNGTAWYPMRVDLPAATGARGARVRFIAVGMPWWVDAAGFATDSTGVFEPLPVAAGLEVSENPVRGDRVTFAWPPATGDARVGIYSFTGARLLGATVPAPAAEYVWDLTVGGRPVVNGAYLVVVETPGQRFRRRLFVAR